MDTSEKIGKIGNTSKSIEFGIAYEFKRVMKNGVFNYCLRERERAGIIEVGRLTDFERPVKQDGIAGLMDNTDTYLGAICNLTVVSCTERSSH